MTTFEHIQSSKIITIIRNLDFDDTALAVEAIYSGGLRLAEVTFDQTASPDVTANIIHTLHLEFQDRILFGAGTVMTMEQLYAAYDAGASYIISPNSDLTIIRETKRLGLCSIPGAFTATEITQSYVAGADIVKLFPSDTAGPTYIKALRGPMPHIPLAAVGGINLENITSFFDAGVCCVGIGANIIEKHALRERNFDAIRALASAYAKKI